MDWEGLSGDQRDMGPEVGEHGSGPQDLAQQLSASLPTQGQSDDLLPREQHFLLGEADRWPLEPVPDRAGSSQSWVHSAPAAV